MKFALQYRGQVVKTGPLKVVVQAAVDRDWAEWIYSEDGSACRPQFRRVNPGQDRPTIRLVR